MNRKKNGFTLVELLATLVILGIVVGITMISVGIKYKETKAKTEDIFVKTLEDALDIYVDTDAKSILKAFSISGGKTWINSSMLFIVSSVITNG